MSNILGGLQGTSYLGTNANQPPNYFFENRDPVSTDVNASLGDFWLNKLDRRLFYLSSLAGNSTSAGSVALWILIGGASGDVESLTTDDATVVLPDLGNIFLAGGLNIFTDGVNDHAIVNLKTSILQPFTTADGSSGVYALGTTNNSTDRFMYAYGTHNTFLGRQAGNLSLTVANATDNTAIGYQAGLALTRGNANTLVGSTAGTSITTGDINVCIGAESALNLTTGSGNIAIGYQSLENALTGNGNVAIGFQAGNALVGAEQGNIYLSNDGVAAENTTIRIGNNLTHTAAYISGVYGVAVDTGSKLVVVMDNTGKLGTSAGGSGGGIETVTANSGGAVSADGSDNINIRGDGTTINAVGVAGTHTVTLSTTASVLTSSTFGSSFSEPFLAIQTSDTGNVTGDGTEYFLGSSVILTKSFDIGNNLFPGDGVGGDAIFTAPATGKYSFTISVGIGTGGSQGPILGIVIPSGTYSSFGSREAQRTFVVALNINDEVTFFGAAYGGLANSMKIVASNNISGFITSNVTFISGYRIA